MRTFVSVLQGDSPETARPVIATSDKRIVDAVLSAINRCFVRKSELNAPAKNRDKGVENRAEMSSNEPRYSR